MTEKKSSIIRVKPEIHHIAKMAACEKLLTLQVWVEQLIEKELRSKNESFSNISNSNY